MSTIYNKKLSLTIVHATFSEYRRFVGFLVAIETLGTIIVLITACSSEYKRCASVCTQLLVFDMFSSTLLLISTVSLLTVSIDL